MEIKNIKERIERVQDKIVKAKEQNDDDLVMDLMLELDELKDDLRFAWAEDEKEENEKKYFNY